jgi:CelD/BcsL family acetyltransferase involved in cellulose biosynthesis
MDLVSPSLSALKAARTVPVATRRARVDLTTIRDLAAFEALRDEWIALFETAGLPHQAFQRFEWLVIWARLYTGRQNRLAIVTGRIDGRLVVAWPLVIRRICGLRVLEGMGLPFAQYADAVVALDVDPAAVDAAIRYALMLPVDVVALRRVRDDAALAAPLRRRAVRPSNRQEAPIVAFAGTPDAAAFEARFPGKVRSNRRRRRRRLEERGAISFVRHGASPETASLVEMAFAFKREWARRAGVTAPALRDHRFEQTFVDACRAGADAPEMRLSVLRSGDDIAGIEISVGAKDTLCGHILAPNPALADFGVGGVLAEATIVSALEQGWAEIDLLAPADDYKMEWTQTTVGVADYIVARTLGGYAYRRLWLGWGREAAKRLAGRLRPLLARRGADAA